MQVLKFGAPLLFTGQKFLENTVVITDLQGKVLELVPNSDAGDDVQQQDGILCPGFINCHCHLELSHMKNLIPEKTGLIAFVYSVVTQRHFNEDEILKAIAVAEQHMIDNGIVAVGDICNSNFTLAQKQQGRLIYYNFIEASGWLPQVADERFSKGRALLHQFQEKLPNNALVPHAPYSVSNKLWQQLAPHFVQKTVTIHNQETTDEDELFRHGTGGFIRMYQMMKLANDHFVPGGNTSLQTYFNQLQTATNVLLVHNTYTSATDIKWANEQARHHHQQLWWCLCPNANLYIEDHLPPVRDLVAKNSNIVVGTDSLASNKQLSILSELKTISIHFPEMPLSTLLQWATFNGAGALNLQEKLGSIETGKQPGLIVIDKNLTTVKRLV